MQYRQQKGERGRGEKWPERRNGRVKQSIAVDQAGADKYLIGMFYELVITLHNGPRCNTIDREKFICPHGSKDGATRKCCFPRPSNNVSRESSATRECNSRNLKSNLHAIERGTHLRARSTVQTFHRWKKKFSFPLRWIVFNDADKYIYIISALCHFDYFVPSFLRYTADLYHIHIHSYVTFTSEAKDKRWISLKGAKISNVLESVFSIDSLTRKIDPVIRLNYNA